MSKFAHIDNNEKLLGWYDDSIHNNIPTPNIKVTEEQWQVAMDNGHNKVNADGSTESFDFRTADEITLAENEQKIAEAKAYLSSTDFYMTVDKYAELDEARKVELTTKRAEARKLINTLKIDLECL